MFASTIAFNGNEVNSMHVIKARNVNDAYRQGMQLLAEEGEPMSSRNGPVLRLFDPVTTIYMEPRERVLFDPQRDANPFFHLMEALWMLHGGNDIRTLDHILPSFREFSDNARTFHGAYGHRWRHWPVYTATYDKELDQVAIAIDMLRKDPTSRRVVIGMWDPVRDLNAASKDIPCNDIIKLSVVSGMLDMMVFNRSNDIVFGAYGANAVHMSMLQEYIASMTGLTIGRYFQISTDFHAYMEQPYRMEKYYPFQHSPTGYDRPFNERREPKPHHLISEPETFDKELTTFIAAIRDRRTVMQLDPKMFRNLFFGNVAIPMHYAFEYHLQKNDLHALNVLDNVMSFHSYTNDWLLAGQEWLLRRVKARRKNPWPRDDVIIKQYLPHLRES